jgi:hypothetical protein
MPRDQCKERVIATTTYAVTGMEVGAALPDDDLASIDQLPAEPLYSEPLSIGIAAVTR